MQARQKQSKPRLTKPLREIRDQQKSTKLIIPDAPFRRLVDEIGAVYKYDLRFRADAVKALQCETEAYITTMFNDTNLFAIHDGRETVHAKDIALWKQVNAPK